MTCVTPVESSKPGQIQAHLVYNLTRAVAMAATIEDVLDAALDCLEGSVDTNRSAILLFDDTDKMRFRAWRGLSAEYRGAVDGHSPWDRQTRDPECVLVPDVFEDESLAPLRDVIAKEGIRSLGFIPLVAASRLIGKFMVYFDEPHEFSGAEIAIAEAIAAQVAFAVEHQLARETNALLDAINREVMEAFGVAVYSTDATGAITRYNQAAAELWGRQPDIDGDRWCGSWKLFHPDGTPMSHEDCPMGIALREKRVVRGQEILVERPDGSLHTVLPYPSPIYGANGELVGAVNVLVDISEQTQMRNDLQEAIRAKDDFLGQVSHELRTPLTIVSGNAQHLVKRWAIVQDGTKIESLSEILVQAERMHRVVNNMLILSRLERGILPEMEPQIVRKLLEPPLDEFRRRFPETMIRAEIADRLPLVETSASTIEQVTWNLLTNAQKYGPAEGPIVLEARYRDARVEVRVLDEGPGVPETEIDRLFETYFRSSAAPAHSSGLGLGLSVCRTLLEAHGGTIWARRREERGMEFGFALPAALE